MNANEAVRFGSQDDFSITVYNSSKEIRCCSSSKRSFGFKLTGVLIIVFFALFSLLCLYLTVSVIVSREIVGVVFTIPMLLSGLIVCLVFFDAFFAQWMPGRWKFKLVDERAMMTNFFVFKHTLVYPVSLAVGEATMRYGDRVAYIKLGRHRGRPVSFGPPFGSGMIYSFKAAVIEALHELDVQVIERASDPTDGRLT